MDSAMIDYEQQILKSFRKEFVHIRDGIWRKNIDGYEDENEKFIKQPHQAYAVPDFIESFLLKALSGQKQVIAEVLEKEKGFWVVHKDSLTQRSQHQTEEEGINYGLDKALEILEKS